MSPVRTAAAWAAALSLALAVTGCSSSSDTATEATSAPATSAAATSPAATTPAASPSASGSVGDANAAFCASSATVKTELGTLRSTATGGSATAEALKTQAQAVATAAEQAKADAQALDAAIRVEVETAQTAFQAAVDAIPADTGAVARAAAYGAAVLAFGKALDAIDAQVGCP